MSRIDKGMFCTKWSGAFSERSVQQIKVKLSSLNMYNMYVCMYVCMMYVCVAYV